MKTFCNICKKSMRLAVLAAICILFLTNTAFAADQPDEEVGPGIVKEEVPPAPEPDPNIGTSLGMFTTTGYCGCKKCSGSSGLTYSGTVPKAHHTISADLSVLPLGTKVRIGDTIYTVEDIGGGVNGHKIDIFYDTHAEALAHGLSQDEVFLISWPTTDAPEEETTAAVAETEPAAPPNGPGEVAVP